MTSGIAEDAHNISDLRDMARRRLPRWLFEFFDRGAEDEVALRNNREAFERIKFVPRILTDISGRKQDMTLFGKQHKMPIAIAPTGAAGMMWYQGELELARAAKAAGIPFSLAIGSITSMEKVAAEVGGTLWMQLYVSEEIELSLQIVRRAAAAGFDALLVTVDGMVAGNREYNKRNGFTVPFRYNKRNTWDVMTHPQWLFGVLVRYLMNGGMPRRVNFPDALKEKVTSGHSTSKNWWANESLNWDDIKVLRDAWPGKLIIKGVLHPGDAERAVESGADAVVVSNHGGRNCDSSPAPIDVLPDIVQAVGHRTAILVDSGFRRGSDVVKALALGADAVLVGRGTLYGIAAAGEAGANRALAIYRDEISRAMAQVGCNSVEELDQHVLLRTHAQFVQGSSSIKMIA